MSTLQENLEHFEEHCDIVDNEEDNGSEIKFYSCTKCNKPTLIHNHPTGDECTLTVLTEEQVKSVIDDRGLSLIHI